MNSNDEINQTDNKPQDTPKEVKAEKHTKQPSKAEKLNEKLCKKEEELKNQLSELDNKYKRVLAEYDNFRKRSQKEKDSFYRDILASNIGSFLPVLDNLERAAEAGDEGVKLILKQFYELLEKYKTVMEGIFGAGACYVLSVRPFGGTEVR